MGDNYPKAYAEVLEVLKYVPEESVSKIPSLMLETMRAKCDKNYDFKVDTTKPFEEQNLLDETNAILANIFRDYWATPKQRTKILEIEEADRKQILNSPEAGESESPDFSSIFDEEFTSESEMPREFPSISEYFGDMPSLRTSVDIAFVLDANQSDRYKENVQLKINDYWNDFRHIHMYYGKMPSSLRISVLWYNDNKDGNYYYKGLLFTDFPDEKEKVLGYFNHLNELKIDGSRTAMDAVYEATESDWNQKGERVRHIIVLMTDHEDPIQKENLHDDQMLGLKGFYMDWNCEQRLVGNSEVEYNRRFKLLNPCGRRMIIFSPDVYPYNEMELECDYIIRCDVKQRKQCMDIKLETIFQLISRSM